MAYNPGNPLIVQGDRTVLVEVDNPSFEEARDRLARFAELEKSPEHIHTYRITPLSLWNAAAAGLMADEMIEALEAYGKYPVPDNLVVEIRDYVGRYGRLVLRPAQTERGDDPAEIYLESDDAYLIEEIWNNKRTRPHFTRRVGETCLTLYPLQRGFAKQSLIKLGFPVEDRVGYAAGAPLGVSLRTVLPDGVPFELRTYQADAVRAFQAGRQGDGGSGVVVLPCGAGKTVVGMAAMAAHGCETLILATNVASVHQWMREIVEKTDLAPAQVGEYTGQRKEVKPVTVTTYQILTHRKRNSKEFPHFSLFSSKDWGLIIYDEVHLLPAEVFRITAEIQARRRLGLTATLVREDHREEDVFTLIGPKRYDVPWKVMEKQGWIATATCTEVRVPNPEGRRMTYATATDRREQYRVAAENPVKLPVVERLVQSHPGENILIFGQFLSQIEKIAHHLKAPLITGKTPNREREKLYEAFRNGEERLLVVSRVANFSLDLPEASVAIQVSGTFGSRQEEAQRLGRILRPKASGRPASFYAVVTAETLDQEYAAKRQLFLTEQGYRYRIERADGADADRNSAGGRDDRDALAGKVANVARERGVDAGESPNAREGVNVGEGDPANGQTYGHLRVVK